MWEQRKLIIKLKEYRIRGGLNHDQRIRAIKHGVNRKDFVTYILKGKLILEDNVELWEKTRNTLDECIEDGYLRQENQEEDGGYISVGEAAEPRKKGSYLFITSKGQKLTRTIEYWFKLIPEHFTVIWSIIFAIITFAIGLNWHSILDKLHIHL